MSCLCSVGEDGCIAVCDQHVMAAWQFEHRVRRVLDAELDAVVREIAGRAPQRIERKVGAIGSFAIARPKP